MNEPTFKQFNINYVPGRSLSMKRLGKTESSFLKGRIKKAGIRQVDLANSLKMPVTTLSSKLNGYAPINTKELKKIDSIIEKEIKKLKS